MKGREVGYSLQAIEKILEKQRSFQFMEVHEKGSDHNIEATTTRQSCLDLKSNERHLNVLEELVKPEQNQGKINDNFLPKKRKKKQHKSQRL